MFTKYLTRREAAEFVTKEFGFPLAPTTLAKLATVGGGPVFRHFGRRVVYESDALIEWANSKLSAPHHSTSDVGFLESFTVPRCQEI